MITVLAIARRILAVVLDIRAALAKQGAQLDDIDRRLAVVENAVTSDSEPASTEITITGAGTMQKRIFKAGLDFTILDNGQAVATLSFLDSLQEPTKVQDGATVSTVWTSSDPQIVATGSADGMTAALVATVTPGAPLSTGVTITAVTTVTNPDSSLLGPFTAVGQPIDVVAGGPAGTSIAEA